MAKKFTNKKTNFANNRPNCLKVTKHPQKVNLKKVTLIDNNGKTITVRMSVREVRALKNAA